TEESSQLRERVSVNRRLRTEDRCVRFQRTEDGRQMTVAARCCEGYRSRGDIYCNAGIFP
ncbi:hypothetical protein BES34_011755, partial [Leptospira inadai serovar Lyme]